MGTVNQFIKAFGISSILLLSSPAFVAAEKIPSSEQEEKLSNSANSITNNEQSRLFNSKIPPSVKANLESSQLSNSDSVFLELTSGKVAQASDSTTDATENIFEPTQENIPSTDSTEEPSPSSDLLSLPTEANEVEVSEQKPITLEKAIKLSFKNNKDVQEARLQLERSELSLREARAALFPTVNLGSSLNYRNDAFLDSFIDQRIDQAVEGGLTQELAEDQFSDSQFESFDLDANATLSYSIYNGGQRGANIRANQKQLRSSKLDLKRVVETTRFETSRDYYNLQDGDAQVEIEEAAVEDANQTLKDAQLLEKAGLGTRFDVLRAEVELAQAQQRLSTAVAQQNIARRQLAETISVSHDTDLSTADEIKEASTWELSLAESVVQAFKNRAELKQLLLQREIGGEQRKIALARVRPTLSADAVYSVNDDFSDDFDPSDQYSVGLNLQWNLFDGGAARAAARQSDKDVEIAETQFANQRNQIRFGVEQAYFGLEANQKNIGTATKEVDLAEESLRLARLRFQAGVGTQTDVIEAQTQLTTARGNLLSSIIDYNQSYVDLERQVSSPSEDELSEDEIPEDEIPEDELPEDELPEDELPEDELPEDEIPEDELPEDEIPEDELQN